MKIGLRSENLGRLNFFYKSIYGEDINMDSFNSRIKLQKLIYILKSEGINFNYDFTWYIYGPYSSALTRDGYSFVKDKDTNYFPDRDEQNIITKMKKARTVLDDTNKAELIASFLYLKEKYGINTLAQEQLKIRKPYFSSDIQRVVQEWDQLTNLISSQVVI
jgi:hypothetical protein